MGNLILCRTGQIRELLSLLPLSGAHYAGGSLSGRLLSSEPRKIGNYTKTWPSATYKAVKYKVSHLNYFWFSIIGAH